MKYFAEILEVFPDVVELLVLLADSRNADVERPDAIKVYPRAELESIVKGMPQYPTYAFIEISIERNEAGRLERKFTEVPASLEMIYKFKKPDYFQNIDPSFLFDEE